MQRMGGGGNDPSCGCDMQAGWPSASVFPRGGLQGGGISSFNVNLINESGKHMRFHGERMNNNSSPSANTPTANLNSAMARKTPKTPRTPSPMNNGPRTPPYAPETPNYAEQTPTPTSSKGSPKTMKKLVHKGKVYYVSPGNNVFEKKKNGSKGKRVGTLVRRANGISIEKGKSSASANIEMTPPMEQNNFVEDYDSLEVNETTPKSLASNGGRRTRRKSRKHLKRK
jgi:hypothetical protein